MSNTANTHSDQLDQNEKADLEASFSRFYYGIKSDSTIIFLTILNLLCTVMRLQDFPGMGFLGIIRAPGALSIITIILVIGLLSRPWLKQMKFMVTLMIFESIRGVLGFRIIEDLVKNDAWQLTIWTTLAAQIFGFVFPIVFCFSNGVQLRKLMKLMLFIGLSLGIWSFTHVGFGPGGYLGDENDNCFALVSLLPIPFAYFPFIRNYFGKLFCVGVGLTITLGAAATNSRGGFIGLFLVILFQFFLSRKKVRWVLSAAVLAIAAVPFIPKKYWDEIYSIKSEASAGGGTMNERMETWTYVTRMWLNPRYTLIGTGLENTPWTVKDYEDADSGITKKSLSGRAAHSMYFQVLGDLGLWGIYIIGGIIYFSIKQLRLVRSEYKKISSLLYSEGLRGSVEKVGSLIQPLFLEIKFIDALASAILCSWLGALGAGVGVSVVYYPIIWFLSALSMAIYLYWMRIRDTILMPIIENRL